jgi:glycosyltransferase involved in cell wall biosynthesis
MRIGILRSLAGSGSGGVFQYETVLLKALSEIAARDRKDLVYICYSPNDLAVLAPTGSLNYLGIPILTVGAPQAQQIPPESLLQQQPQTPPPSDPNITKFDYVVEDNLRRAGIDLLLLLSPNVAAFSFRLPFVVPIFDLNHRLQPEFPEVSAYGEMNSREYFYINTFKFATLVLVDSQAGRDDVLRFYSNLIDEERIRIMPYYPPIKERAPPDAQELVRVRTKYGLPERYFFYPAQFWPHKNHALIVQAVKRIADESGEKVAVVFTGSYWSYIMASNFKEVMGLAGRLGIAERVRYLGSVPDADMAALYTLSAGLVMPTFFGPTNIPPLEAWHFGRPVITSDIRGVREHIGDAGLLIDPRSPQALAEAMLRLWRDDDLCTELTERGRKQLSSYNWSNFVDAVAAILDDACERVRSDRTPRYPDPEMTSPAGLHR